MKGPKGDRGKNFWNKKQYKKNSYEIFLLKKLILGDNGPEGKLGEKGCLFMITAQTPNNALKFFFSNCIGDHGDSGVKGYKGEKGLQGVKGLPGPPGKFPSLNDKALFIEVRLCTKNAAPLHNMAMVS